MELIPLSIIFFAIGAVLGLVMLEVRRRNVRIPYALPIGHGVFVVAGLVSLWVGLVMASEITRVLFVAAILFLIAAAGGLILLLTYFLRKVRIPMSLIVAHGVVAATAFALLVFDQVSHR